MPSAFAQGIDRRITDVSFGSSLIVISYDFRCNVDPKPVFPLTNLPFEGDFDVTDEDIEAVFAKKPPFEKPPLVNPISKDMLERLNMFRSKKPTVTRFLQPFEGAFIPNLSQTGNIFFNLLNIRKVLDKKATTFTMRADKPSVSGDYVGTPHEVLEVATIFASSRDGAIAAMRFQIESIPGFDGSYISTEFATQHNPPFEDQWGVGLNYIETSHVKKFVAWQATAYSYRTKTRTFDFGPGIAAGQAPPAPKNIDKKTKADGFGALKDKFEFTVDLKTLKFR